MYFGNKEDRDNAIKKRIEDRQEAADLFCIIRPVIEAYDMKCFNCRLEKALQAASNKRIFAKKDYKHIVIYFYSKNCNQYMTLASIATDDLIEGKRIPAAKLLESARNRRADHLKEAASMKEAIIKADEIKSQLQSLKAQMHAISNQISSYEARDIYGLNVHIQFN